MYDGRFVRVGNAVSGLDPAFYPKSRIICTKKLSA